ncbi:uncharacterized protein LOC134201709 [Bombyx mori]|uniref:uncharacterized protein LOC134201709 n=1 Tax=Bombyx mori TaxID=7091 RepID=UPI002ED67094
MGEGIEDHGKYILHYKGETPGQYGVGFLIKRKYMDRIEELKGISERIAILNIKFPVQNSRDELWSIIQVYSPTEADKKQDTNKIEEFYQKLQITVDTAHKNLIIMGDFNGQIGECRSGEEYIVGRYGNGNRSKNGQHLVNFGLENKLSILNSFFKKKKNKKWTWTSPNGLFKNEIDYIMTNKPKVFKDLSVLHNLNFNSDHKMIRATLRASHTKKSRRLQTGLTPYVDIKNNLEIMNNLKEFLERREQKEYNKTIEATYCYFVNTLKTVARKVSTNNKSILSTETIILLKERKLLLQGNKDKETRKEIAEISKNINKNIRKDRKQKRANTFQYHIKKTGGVKKAFKELESKKNWMPNIKDRQGRNFNKAFDSLEHHYIWESLEQQGVHKKYIRILKNIYGKSTAQIKLEKLGEEFPIERGVRQGDPISPKIFSAVLELIFRKLDWDNFGLNVNGDKLSHLRFADDLILFSECPMILERMLQQLADESANAGLTMNITKTKVMSNSSQKNAIAVNNQELEYVSEYVYLGQLVSPTESMQKEIERRIANTWKKFWSLSEVMKNKEMPMAEKRKVFNVCILPCLTYGCQTWALTEKQQNKLNICQNGIERSVLGVRRRDKIELKKIKGETKFGKVQSICRKLKWRWTGHMMRKKKEKWTRIITEWYPRENKRIRGRQPKRWEDDLKQVAGPEWLRTAKDRSKWKSLKEAFVERQAVKRRDKPNAEICFSIS